MDRCRIPRGTGRESLSLLLIPRVRYVLGAILGVVFVYASLDKIAHPEAFAKIVYHYQMIGPSKAIPPALPNVFAVALPWIELVAGVLLLFGIWRREAAALVALLLAMFLVAVGSALARGIDVANCGCFTVTSEGRRLGASLLVADSLMLVAALGLAFTREPSTTPATSAPR